MTSSHQGATSCQWFVRLASALDRRSAGRSGLENLKVVRACGWTSLTQLKANRKVDLDRQG